MPKIAKELTAVAVKALPDGTHSLGGVKGLYLRKRHGIGWYILRYKIAGASHDLGLGAYPRMSLALARKVAREARDKIEQGIDPLAEKKAKAAAAVAEREAKERALNPVTFEQVAEEWMAEQIRQGQWARNQRREASTRQVLEKHVYPFFGSMDIEAITPEDVRTCLAPIWKTVPRTADKAKTYIKQIFRWAIALHKRKNQVNPASMDGALGVLMESYKIGRKERQNYSACSVEELPRLMAELDALAPSTSARALQFSFLTATRSKAVRLAEWKQFNLEERVWRVPLDNDKMKSPNRDRTIFLSSRAVALLESLPHLSGSDLVFPSNRGTALGDAALGAILKRLHLKRKAEDGIGWIDPVKSQKMGSPQRITQHGTARATFRTWAKDDALGNNRRFDQEAVELCLLHSKDDAYHGAYDRAPLEKERRAIVEAWGEYCYSYLDKLCTHSQY